MVCILWYSIQMERWRGTQVFCPLPPSPQGVGTLHRRVEANKDRNSWHYSLCHEEQTRDQASEKQDNEVPIFDDQERFLELVFLDGGKISLHGEQNNRPHRGNSCALFFDMLEKKGRTSLKKIENDKEHVKRFCDSLEKAHTELMLWCTEQGEVLGQTNCLCCHKSPMDGRRCESGAA